MERKKGNDGNGKRADLERPAGGHGKNSGFWWRGGPACVPRCNRINTIYTNMAERVRKSFRNSKTCSN
ncbi:hypothetical protein XAPC_1781 [Xanthomonas citri pv. punicae str. LMG 859]|nr:hypothetical protein XAR_2535 [Xanthomonas citri pv. glycines str. 8ra]CCF68074.1 hypothetical protein XAPC_1781 [Xanthomonas citri pv. punicae str. LMG 859]